MVPTSQPSHLIIDSVAFTFADMFVLIFNRDVVLDFTSLLLFPFSPLFLFCWPAAPACLQKAVHRLALVHRGCTGGGLNRRKRALLSAICVCRPRSVRFDGISPRGWLQRAIFVLF